MKKHYPVHLRRTINYLQELERELDAAGVDRITPLLNELAAYRNATPLLHAQIEELNEPLNPVRRENAALRRERVKLQAENEALRADLEAAKQAATPVEIEIGDTVRLIEGAQSLYGTPLFVAPSYVVVTTFAEGRELHIRQAEAEPGNGGWWVTRDQIAEAVR